MLQVDGFTFHIDNNYKDYTVNNYAINLHIFVQYSYLGLMHPVNNRNYSINRKIIRHSSQPFSISSLMQLVFIHHHLPTTLGETGFMDCHILQFGTVHRQLYMVVHARAAKCFAGSGAVAVYDFQQSVWSSIRR